VDTKVTVTDEEVEKLLKDLKKIGIKGYLVTGKEKEYSKKTKEKHK